MNGLSDQNDQQLLRDYAANMSEAAFAELVRRHVDLVHSAAMRMLHDAHQAEDVTQGVFVALAWNARQLSDRRVLSPWLHRTAQNIASKAIRSDVRRRAREQEAAAMNELLSGEPDSGWEQIAPHLDAALGELSEQDREALMLRYFERKSGWGMAQALGISEEAAQKRATRAVERLRKLFAKRGVAVPATSLVVVLSANAVQAAPVGLAAAISTSAMLGGTALLTSATKAIAMTALQKTFITATIAAAVGVGIYESHQAAMMRSQVQTLERQQATLAEQMAALKTENERLPKPLAEAKDSRALSQAQFHELLKLRGEVARLRGESKELAQLKAGGAETANNPAEVAAKAWAGRAADLVERVGQMPEMKMPEFRFLTPDDWLDVAKDAALDTDTDVRNAALILGGLAKDEFAKLMKTALNGFLDAHKGELPTEINQLKPFFQAPLEDEVLQRYELLRSGNVENVPKTDKMFRLIAEKPFAPAGSGRPIVQVGTEGFIRTGQ